MEAIRAAAEQRAAAAGARAASAEQRAAEAGRWRADADAAAEEMAVQMDAAQARAGQAEAARAAAEADRDAGNRPRAGRRASRLGRDWPGPRDADKMLTGFRADAARDRDELRADLRARAEHAERQADAYSDELAQLRAGISHDADTITVSRTPRRTRQPTQP